jgi:hypothetical protein
MIDPFVFFYRFFSSSQDVQLKNVIDAWILKQAQEAQSALKDFTNNTLYNAISRAANFVRKLSQDPVFDKN